MNRPLLALAGLIVAGGTTGVAAIIVVSSGGEEEVVQQPATATVTAASATLAPGSPTPTPIISATPAPSASPEPSPTPLPEGWEVYNDPQGDFSFPHPAGLVLTEQFFDQVDKGGNGVGQVRTLSFRHSTGTPAISMAIAPNLDNLSLEDWIRTVSGWPSEPRPLSIGGQPALLFEINQMGQRYPGAYFGHGNSIFSISANIFGAAELGVSAAPGISETDFEQVMQGFRFVSP